MPRDLNRVDLHDHADLDYWRKRLGCTRAQLVIAVHSVGPMAHDVSSFLREIAASTRRSPTGAARATALVAPRSRSSSCL